MFNPFTAKHDPTLTTEEIMNTDPINRPIDPFNMDLPTYDPEIHTLIDGTVVEVDLTGAQRFSNGKTLVDTVKHVQGIEYRNKITESITEHNDRHAALLRRIEKAQAGFREFLITLWDSGLDQDKLTEIFEEKGLPTLKKAYSFTATVTISVYGIKGFGTDEAAAWDDAINNSRIADAFSDGNYDSYSLEEPTTHDEAEEDSDETEDPDFSGATIWDLA